MGLRIAEIGEHTVAQVSRDETIGLGDDFGATSVIGTDDLLQILWVEPGRERRRADEVTEHDRNLAALSVVPPLGVERGCRRRGRKLDDCCQHLAPMPD